MLALGRRKDIARYKRGSAVARAIDNPNRITGKVGTPGEGDIMVILAPRGRILYLEAKTGKARQQENQKDFQAIVTKLGAQYHVFHSIEEAIAIVDNAER